MKYSGVQAGDGAGDMSHLQNMSVYSVNSSALHATNMMNMSLSVNE